MSIVNLLPEDYVTQKAKKRANLMCMLLFVTVMIGVSAGAIVSDRKCRRTSEVCQRVNQSYEEAGKLIKEMQALDVTRYHMLKKANITATLLERVPRSYLLAMITKALPKGASLTKFELNTKYVDVSDDAGKSKSKYEIAAAQKKSASKQTTKKKLEVSIAVTGLAATNVEVGRFIATMERSPLVESDFIFSREKKVADSIVSEFEVILHLKENADVGRQSPDAETAMDRSGTDKRES